MRKHLKNFFILMISLIVGISFFSWGLQQFDLMVSPLIAKYAMDWTWWFPLKGWFGFQMQLPDAYVYCFYMIAAGFAVAYLGLFVALWWWSE